MQNTSYLPEVKEQYEDFPYPPRKAEDERRFLRAAITECLDALNHFGFGGRRNFHQNFRALIAGGGTGDSVIFLAEQLRNTQAEIIYLDMSRASMEVAQARAEVRDLHNIRWINASLLEVPTLGLGEFDYINCTGVLHHLENPDAGLKALTDVLAPNGVMGLMLYGKHGRTAIYQMQELLRMLAGEETPDNKIEIAKRVLHQLPKTNWFMHSAPWFNDFKNGDAALYDLLLHSQDRAYSIPELYEYVQGAGLKVVEFLGHNACDPAQYIKDDSMLARVREKELAEQYAIGELLGGTASKHTFYATREVKAPPAPDDLDMIPSLPVNTPPTLYNQLYELAVSQPKGIVFRTENRTIRVPFHAAIAPFVKYMDGKRTLKEIYTKATTLGNIKRTELQEAFAILYEVLTPAQMLFLRHKDVPYYLTTQEMQQRLQSE